MKEERFSNEELKNIALLISKANITGGEAMVVALLLQKINTLLAPPKAEVAPQEEKKD